MTRVSDLLTSSSTIISDARSALGVDAAPGSHDADARLTFEKFAPAAHVGASPDLDAEADPTVNDLLTIAALKRALGLALSRARSHTAGGLLGVTAAVMTLISIETDPALDATLDEQADALLAHADSLLHAVPSEPSDEVRESERLAEAAEDIEVQDDAELQDELAAAREKRWAPVADDVQEAA